MPQEFRVGHRSSLVSLMGWLLMGLGLAGVVTARWLDPMAVLLALTWSMLALATGGALVRRLEWGRRCAGWLLATLLPVLLLGWWLTGATVPTLALVPASGALALLLSWVLSRLNSRGVRQEFA